MAYERPLADLEKVAQILQYDDWNDDIRLLCNIIYEALGYTNANITGKTVAQMITDLTTLLGR